LLEKWGVESVDILKIDIERAEHALFRSAESWLPKVRSIVIEFHDHESNPSGPDQCCARLEAHGFTLLPESGITWACRNK